MAIMFDFRCSNSHVTEALVESGTDSIICGHCGEVATRQLAAPRARLEGITGAFPGAAMQWERNRASHMARERKMVKNHGEYPNGQKAGA